LYKNRILRNWLGFGEVLAGAGYKCCCFFFNVTKKRVVAHLESKPFRSRTAAAVLQRHSRTRRSTLLPKIRRRRSAPLLPRGHFHHSVNALKLEVITFVATLLSWFWN
jgi:hypothetical protein